MDAVLTPEREAELLAADAIGDIIEHWGIPEVASGRVWTVLFLAADTLPAQAVGERLSMSAGAVSMSLSELQRWGVVRRVWKPGERKEFFEAETDFWRMISKVFDERERLPRRERPGSPSMRAGRSFPARPGRTTRLGEPSIGLNRSLPSFVIVAETALDGFIRSRRVDFTRFGDLVRFPLRSLGRKKG